MKAENLEEAKRIISRLNDMESALQLYDKTKENEFSWSRLFVNIFKTKKSAELEIGYNSDDYICVSMEQQEELATLLRKWVQEDKAKLETL